MPENPEQRFKRIQTLLLAEPINRLQIISEVTVLHRDFAEVLESTQRHVADIRALEEKLKKLSEPPLVHGVLIGTLWSYSRL